MLSTGRQDAGDGALLADEHVKRLQVKVQQPGPGATSLATNGT